MTRPCSRSSRRSKRESDDLRAQFDANVFGAVATIKAVLPQMRERRSGHIFGVTSMAGLMTVPGLSFYHGSKYALEGILETVGKEVSKFGVHVTAIAPGSFRTNWAGAAMSRADRSIADYDDLFDPIRAARQTADGEQLGNPEMAAEAVMRVIDAPNPPAHLVLGSDALRLVTGGRSVVDQEIANWRGVTLSTDFPDGHQIT
jgi:NAD(P)-dependent dehydrogenase (short-subunit alcohol dehydrogenase family)